MTKYKEAGVDIEKGYESVKLIKKHIASTKNIGVEDDFGSFGSSFNLYKYNIKEPVLVSGTDGVGTKLLLAIENDSHESVGIDLVAMCVNDIITCGAIPLYFLDYLAVYKNIPLKVEEIVKGVVQGCKESGCALIGGETAEMPGMYSNGHYDMAGFVVGVVERSLKIDNSKIKTGDKIIGIKSSGLHSNGFSLVRKILSDSNININETIFKKEPLIKTLLKPTKIYAKSVQNLISKVPVKGMANITGGGFYENIPRMFNKNGAKIYKNSWPIDEIFQYLQNLGDLSIDEMYNVFNMSIGYVVVVDEQDVDLTIEILKETNEKAFLIGEVCSDEGVYFV